MYICPTCHRRFQEEQKLTKHFLSCWKEQHPFHQSKPAPKGKDIMNFFNSFKER